MQTWETPLTFPETILPAHATLNSEAAIMRPSGPWILVVQCVLLGFPQQSLLQRRQCVFHVNNKTHQNYTAGGDVKESVQFCKNTNCCEAIYQIINEHQAKIETLACNVLNEPCPEETCKAQEHFRIPFIRCVCSTDLCNSNITWVPAEEGTLHTESNSAAKATKTVLVVMLFFSILIFAMSWRKLCKGNVRISLVLGALMRRTHNSGEARQAQATMEDQNEEENQSLQSSCEDYIIQPLCSCHTKASESNITDIGLQEVLGHGCFATVFQGRYNNSVVAVKVYPAGWKQKFTAEKEIYELPLMEHSGIVQFLGAGRKPDDGSWMIVLQYAEYGSLHSFLCKHTSSWMMSLKLCQSLSQGLSYLHSDLLSHGVHKPPVAHRDLSSFNVLVKADGTCALCDFGSSTILRFCSGCHFWQNHMTKMKGTPQFGTLHYMSPEVLDGSVNLSSSSFLMQGDIYALGLILWEIWMRCSDLFKGGVAPQHLLPYELELEASVTLERLFLFVSEMDKRPSIPDHWGMLPQGSALKEILTDCWDRDMDARLTAPCVVNRLVSLTSSYPH